MKKLLYFFEKNAFGVCAKIGERLGISSESIRISFIYISFITFGSPIFIYLVLAFWIKMKAHLRRYRQIVRGL